MTPPPPSAADLVLIRLAVPSAKPVPAADLRKDVGRVFGREFAGAEWAEVIDGLGRDGLVEPRPKSRGGVQLTAAGRRRALAVLGVSKFPARANWQTVRSKYLFPRAVGATAAEAAELADAGRVTAFLLRREHDLPPVTTAAQALQALVCRQLGHPDETTLDGLFRAVLSRYLGSDERLSRKDLLRQVPRKLTGAKAGGLDDLRQAVVRRWLAAAPPPGFDLPGFAAAVRRLAGETPPAGRFGRHKAFVAAVWQMSQAADGFPRLPLAEFKGRLAEANRAGLVRLEPADLVQAMDPALVSDSETVQAGAAFHLILIEEARP